jgi:hypothetical protein
VRSRSEIASIHDHSSTLAGADPGVASSSFVPSQTTNTGPPSTLPKLAHENLFPYASCDLFAGPDTCHYRAGKLNSPAAAGPLGSRDSPAPSTPSDAMFNFGSRADSFGFASREAEASRRIGTLRASAAEAGFEHRGQLSGNRTFREKLGGITLAFACSAALAADKAQPWPPQKLSETGLYRDVMTLTAFFAAVSVMDGRCQQAPLGGVAQREHN